MVGAIPFDPRQPSSLYIPGILAVVLPSGKTSSARRFTRSQSLNVVERQAIPEQTTFEQMVARAAALTATPQVDKVVLSRLIDITTDAAIDSGVLLERLIAQNPVVTTSMFRWLMVAFCWGPARNCCYVKTASVLAPFR